MAQDAAEPNRTGRLERILDALAVFVVVMDREGRMTLVDERTVSAGGVAREALLGTAFCNAPWWAAAAGQPERLRAAVETAARSGFAEIEAEAWDREGASLPIALSLSAVRDSTGAVTEIVATGLDLSRQHRAEARRTLSDAEAERRLAELEALYDALPVGVALHDREMRFLRINKRMAEIDGISVEDHIGRKGDELSPGADPEVTRIVKTMFETGEPVLGLEVTAEIPSDPGVVRDFLADYYPVKIGGEVVAVGTCVREVTRERRLKREAIPQFTDPVFQRMDDVYRTGEAVIDEELAIDGFGGAVFYSALLPWFHDDGSIGGVIGFGYDITEQVGARDMLENAQAELRKVLDRTLALVAVIDVNGRVADLNAAARSLFGVDRDAAIRAPFETMLWVSDGDSSALVGEAVALAVAGQGVRFDVEFRAASGKTGVLDLMLSPEKDARGRVRRVVASAFDITERTEAAERIELLLQEVNHRSKNLLGLVQAVARQTRGADLGDFRNKFQRRLAGLSAAQDLVTAHDWGDVELADLVENQVGAFSHEIGARIRLDGPRGVMINARAAQSLGMALHELVTNAAKYGALSNREGEVKLSWRQSEDGLSISWVEAGGPEVSAPTASGFGSLVIDTVVADALCGDVTLDYAADGLRWRLDGGRVSAPAANDRRSGPRRVLIVEDAALIAADLAFALTDAGYEVLGPAPTGRDALAVIERGGCDLAV
ncbi:MAG: PAS domain-containing sensor histidine kinase, partial [Oceanicaulis sp.]